LAFAAEAVREEREATLAIVAAEEEMDGEMPDVIWNACATKAGASEVLRAAVRATKRNISATIRARHAGAGEK
jgi:hypothetical protein